MNKKQAKRLLNHPFIRHKVRHFIKSGGTIKFYVSDKHCGVYTKDDKTIVLDISIDYWMDFLCAFEHEYTHFLQDLRGILHKRKKHNTYQEYLQCKLNERCACLASYRLASLLNHKEKNWYTQVYPEEFLYIQNPRKKRLTPKF